MPSAEGVVSIREKYKKNKKHCEEKSHTHTHTTGIPYGIPVLLLRWKILARN
jgi:hypothetical protein